MKKRILIIFSVVILLIVVVLFSFRHFVIGHAIMISISKKTNENITLKIGNVNYSVIHSSVSFIDSELLFSNTYLNKEETIELSELKFDEIRLEGLSLWNLLFKREFIANKILIKKPSLWFSENDNSIHFKEKPKEIVNSLKEQPDLLGNLTIVVDEFEIANGLIDIKQIIDSEEHNGSVEFELLLRDFNTSTENIASEDRFLFAEKHFLKLSNFNYFLPNGDKLSFDSTVFETGTNSLISSNIRIEVVSGSVHPKFNPIIAEVSEVLIGGIDFNALENMHDIYIDSISISDVYLNITKNDSSVSEAVSDTSTHKLNLFKVIQSFNLGSFSLNNINLLNHTIEGDTIINLENLNFDINDIKLDSILLANKMPDIDFGSIRMSSGALKVVDEKSGLRINLNSLLFAEKEGIISLSGLKINDHGIKGSKKFITDVDSVAIYGVSVEDFVEGQQLKIGVLVSNPEIDLNISQDSQRKGVKSNLALDKFEITNFQISNGLIHLYDNDEVDINIFGLDFNSGKILLGDLNEIHKINTDNLALSTSEVKILIPKNNLRVTSGPISLINNSVTINNISTIINDESGINSSIFVNQLQLGGADIGKIISDKEIDLEYIRIIKPQIKGNLTLISDKSENSHKKPANNFDYSLNIDDFQLTGGKVDLNLNLNHDDLKLKSGVEVKIVNINIADSKDTSWLRKLLWKVNLSQPTIVYQDYLISCSNVESDNARELLLLQNIEIVDNVKSSTKSGVDIRELSIQSVNFSGLDYNTIIENKTPEVRAIFIENPYFDLKIDGRNQKTKDSTKVKKSSMPVDVDEFEINHLSFKIEKQDSISVSNFSLANLDFKYGMTSVDNIVDGLYYFNATNFFFSDTIKNSFAEVEELNFIRQENKLQVTNLSGGTIKKQLDSDNFLSYVSSEFEISGIDISKTMPYDISINGIGIYDLQLDVESYKSTSNEPGLSAKKKLQLPRFVNSFAVDIFTASKVDFKHVTITDTSVKELKLNKLGFLINSIKIDSSTFENNNIAFAEQVSVSLKENKIIFSDSLYEASVNSISYNFSENILEVDSLTMKPRFEPAEFFERAVYEIGRTDIVTDKIVCHDLRLKKLITEGVIHVGGVDVWGLDIRIFKNKKYSIRPNTYKKMPQELLLSIPKALTIDSLKTHDAYLLYKQLSPKSVVPGEIFLNDFNLALINVNNNLKVVDESSAMIARLNAMLLGEAELNLKVTMPILSPAYDFWVTGHLDKIDLTKLNSMTQNLVGITMARGTGELDFPLISGNSHHSEGSILFKYKKLKIDLYDREKATNTTGLTNSMANLLLNDILIKSNNPGFLGRTRPGEVYFERDTQRFIVQYIWKSIMSGLMSTMGYNNKEQRQEKRANRRSRK